MTQPTNPHGENPLDDEGNFFIGCAYGILLSLILWLVFYFVFLILF